MEATQWELVYKSAERDNGELFFPERLTREFLNSQKKTMGLYEYSNQYLNKTIPEESKIFKDEWIRYYDIVPSVASHTFAFIDPAIGQNDGNDYTGMVVIKATSDKKWYVIFADRKRMTPTETAEKVFEIQRRYNPITVGIEAQSYQQALVYLLSEEMIKRKINVPIKAVKRTTANQQMLVKNTRILSLVPRFEWGNIYLSRGMYALEEEIKGFPRAAHDDILDALASLEEVVMYPDPIRDVMEKPHSQSSPDYERWYIQNLGKTR